MVKVIATDLDGTLLKPKKPLLLIDKENKKYIKKFYGDIVIVSGRTPKFCAKICSNLKIRHNFIALNGAIIVKEGEIIFSQSMKKTALMRLFEFLKENYKDFELLLFDKYDRIINYSTNTKKTKLKNFKHAIKNVRLHDKIIVNNDKAIELLKNETEIYKAIVYKQNCEDIYNQLKEKFRNHFEFFASSKSIEISPTNISKGASLQYLINTTKLKNDEIYVVGDGVNDISMFNKFQNSFSMESASELVKLRAKNKINKFSDLEKYTKINNNFKKEW